MDLEKFRRKYDASPFDPTDPNQALAEECRQAVVTAFLDKIEAIYEIEKSSDRAMEHTCAGLLVGLVGIMSSHMEKTDQNHESLRAGLIQMMPWAVDTMRAIEGLDPLPDD